VQALRFFYGVTLKVAWDIKMLPFHKQHRSIPVVLSTSETATLLAAPVNPKHRALLMTVYSSGLRLNEVRQLRLDDLDADRMVIHVRAGKGDKERYVMLSEKLAAELAAYRAAAKPALESWLFPGVRADRPLSERTIQKMVGRAACLLCARRERPITLSPGCAEAATAARAGSRRVRRTPPLPVRLSQLKNNFTCRFLSDTRNNVVLTCRTAPKTALDIFASHDGVSGQPSPLGFLDQPTLDIGGHSKS